MEGLINDNNVVILRCWDSADICCIEFLICWNTSQRETTVLEEKSTHPPEMKDKWDMAASYHKIQEEEQNISLTVTEWHHIAAIWPIPWTYLDFHDT